MISELSSVTSDLVTKVLDASLLRHKIISANIANHNVENYQPLIIDFESLLRKELEGVAANNADARLERALEAVEPVVTEHAAFSSVDGESQVGLDQHMVELAENTLRYEALVNGLSKLGDLKSMAIKGRGQ